MANVSSVSINEEEGQWDIRHRSTRKNRPPISPGRNGSHLQPMFVEALTVDGEADALALKVGIEGLTVFAEPGYPGGDRHRMSIERARDGKFLVKLQTTDTAGNQQETGDYETASYDSIQDAYAGLAASMNAPTFSAQITALVL